MKGNNIKMSNVSEVIKNGFRIKNNDQFTHQPKSLNLVKFSGIDQNRQNGPEFKTRQNRGIIHIS